MGVSVNRRKSIVILGSGFGGVYTAMELQNLPRRERDIEITLVNRENYLLLSCALCSSTVTPASCRN